MNAPRIGLTTYGLNAEGRFHLPAAYVECVRRAGGLPYLLSPGEPRLAEWLETIDALVLTGGGDLDPARYGGKPHAKVYGVDPARDETDLGAARAVIATGRPALCICRGAQVLNVALGGTLIEHLPDVVGERVRHRPDLANTVRRKPPPAEQVLHAIEIEPTSRVASILGSTRANPSSSHHQAIGAVAKGLEVVARAPDGTIEAVELPGHPWLVAVQWHPEHTAAEDPAQQRLFDELVRAARERRRR